MTPLQKPLGSQKEKPPMIETLSVRSDIHDLRRALARDGAVIVEDFLSPQDVDSLVLAYKPYSDRTDVGTNVDDAFQAAFYGKKTKRFTGLIGKSPSFQQVVLHPIYQAVADDFLLKLSGEYVINTAEMIEVYPGSPAQYVHRDAENWPEAFDLGELLVASIVALTDFTAENGATRVVPGSHLWHVDRRPTDAECVPAVMRKGSAVIYLGRTLHGAGANQTRTEIRNSFHLSFCLGWLRTEENHFIATPFDLVPTLEARTRQLLGFSTYKPKVMPAGMLGLKDCEDIGPLFAPAHERASAA